MTAERRRQLIARAALALWAAGTACLIWLMLVYPNRHQVTPYKDFVVELPAGATAEVLAKRMAEDKVVSDAWALTIYFRLMGVESNLRRGYVVLNRALSVRELLPRLARNFGTSKVRVLLPEGFTRFDAATRLERFGVASRAALLSAGSDPALLQRLGVQADSVEGYLFPAVYDFSQESDANAVLTRMVRVFRERTQALFDAYAMAHDGAPFSLTPHQLLTLASIVEREARVPDERPVIAGVFMNRLVDETFKPKRLQADPTVAYGCLVARDKVPTCAEYDGRRITPAMLRDPENPYSTYRRDGLPPGPICSPGLDSLKAALTPAAHDYFYFVTKGGGRHAFSHSLEDHNQRIKESP
ncbi:MAG: endolytic transglycosylase MltG [Myxococcales bacterium]